MATFKEVEKQLTNLPLTKHKLIDIVKLITSIDKLQDQGLFDNSPFNTDVTMTKNWEDNFYHEQLQAKNPITGKKISLEDVWIDISYQRVLRLKKIISHLERLGIDNQPLEFNKMLAGSIDISVRPNGDVFVWDGFRRSIIALLNGKRYIQAAIYVHNKNLTEIECQKQEAFAFKVRNGDSESMLKEELYKSGIVYNDRDSLKVLDFLQKMKADVLGTNPGNPTLGGFSEFQDTVLKNKLHKSSFLIDSSKSIQDAWKNETTLSGYLVCGLAKFFDVLNMTDDSDSYLFSKAEDYDIPEDIVPKLKEYALTNNQISLIKNRLHGKAIETVAYNIAKKVMKFDQTILSEFADLLGFEDEQIQTLNVLNYNSSNSTKEIAA